MTKIVCSVCSSDDVQIKVWTKPNENYCKTTDFVDELLDEPADCWCCNCQENQKLMVIDGGGEQVKIYVGPNIGDFVRCNNCNNLMLIPCGTEVCPECGKEGFLAWERADSQEMCYEGLKAKGFQCSFKNSVVEQMTCPNCHEESLRYAMIDLDGTNLEEGYSCSGCGEKFIGLENEAVIEFNPQITQENG